MPKIRGKFSWQDKIVNSAQIAGIETSVLDQGLARGLRIAWVNTGSGLRYKVVIDRCLDIADAFFNQHSLTWQSHAGLTAPRPDANHDFEWLWNFYGGLMVTCGLTHIGSPEDDEEGRRGLHGRISNFPACIESIAQPDLAAGRLDMSITAVTRQSCVFGPNLEIRRTISSLVGEPVIRIHDIVTNRGNVPTAHMILYHCNFGWPLVDEGTDIVWKGNLTPRDTDQDRAIFNSKRNYRKCQKPMPSHSGRGEAGAFIDVSPDTKGLCTAGLYNRRLNLAVALRFKKKQLPWLTNWQHWGAGEYVTGIEPGTNPPMGRQFARRQKALLTLGAGKSRTYDLEIAVLTQKEQLTDFLKSAGQ